MSPPCIQCGSSTLWDDSVSSAVCTECGTLVDSSQSVLTSSTFANQNDTFEPSVWDSTASITLKGFRGGNNWDLAGQGKEARDRKNKFAMAEFTKSLAVSFNATGLSPRAITLFNQYKAASNLRWGQRARTVAGACLAIAFRESNRPDSLRDIASLLGVPSKNISREFTSIITTLKLSLTVVDPSIHIPAIQNHLASALKNSGNGGVSAASRKLLGTLCLRSAAKTAVSLCHLLTRLCPEHEIVRLPVAPTACGIFLLALEAEKRSSINSLGDLARSLATYCHSSQSVVMARYKIVQDQVASWTESIPWLDKYESKGGRAQVAKRVIVARGLKEVIQFQDDLWRRQAAPSLDLELDDTEQHAELQPIGEDVNGRSSKRQKMDKSMSKAFHFLLNPHGPSVPPSASQHQAARSSSSHMPLAAYMLANPSIPWTARPPTRLQILAQERGGATELEIPDDDLFAEGEFEKIWRSLEEVEVLRKTFGWDNADDTPAEPSTSERVRRPRRTRISSGTNTGAHTSPPKKSRINLQALAQLLADDGTPEESHSLDEESAVTDMLIGIGPLIDEPDSDDEHHKDYIDFANDSDDDFSPSMVFEANTSTSGATQARKRPISEVDNYDDECVIDSWRAPTPDGLGDDCRYEQERPP